MNTAGAIDFLYVRIQRIQGEGEKKKKKKRQKEKLPEDYCNKCGIQILK